jgi:hypothetical protein
VSSPQGPEFPSHPPTRRDLNPGTFPTKSFRSQSGVESMVQYGNRRSGQTLELSYGNTTEAIAAAIYDHYLACRGTVCAFGLSEAAKAGHPGFHKGDSSTSAQNRYSAAPFGMKYKYQEPPQFSSAKPGVMSVNVKLIGVLDS